MQTPAVSHPVVFDGIEFHPVPHPEHDFLLTNGEVATGFDVEPHTINTHKRNHADELVEGKHWIKATIDTAGGRQRVIQWTKRGIVRLGFFIRSERAKRFRDWAEDLIVAHRPILPAQCKEEIITPQIMGYKGNLAKQKKKIEELRWENAGLRNKIEELEKRLKEARAFNANAVMCDHHILDLAANLRHEVEVAEEIIGQLHNAMELIHVRKQRTKAHLKQIQELYPRTKKVLELVENRLKEKS